MTERSSENKERMGVIGDRPYWAYSCSFLVRAAHQVGAGVVLAAYLLDVIPKPPGVYVAVVFISGSLLFVLEFMKHRQLYRELAGMITIIKTLLLGAVFHGYLPPQWTVISIFIAASLGAHAPKKIRHRLLL